LHRDSVHVTIHYDDTTQFFSDEDLDVHDEQSTPLTNMTCNDLLDRRVEVKVLAMPDGTLHAVRVEIKGEFPEGEFPESEEFQVSGTLTPTSLTLHTTTTVYTVAFPEGAIRVEGRLTGEQTVLAREIETLSVAENFEIIGTLDSGTTLTLTDAADTVYTIHFPVRPIKVEGTLDTSTNTITAREIEVLP
jgi:hypothetical protein